MQPTMRERGFSPAEQAQFYGAALALSVGAALSFAAAFGLRLGLGDTWAQAAGLWLMAVLPLWATAWAATRFAGSARAAAGAMMAAFLAASLLPVAGLWLGSLVIPAAGLLALLCMALGASPLLAALRAAKMAMLATALASALLLVVTNLPGRLLLPEQLLLGLAPSDEYFHTALAGMVAHYHRFAIGADGLSFMPYHFLSHVIAAGMAGAARTDVPHVYLYWGAFTLKLQLVWTFFVASLFFTRDDAAPPALFWRLAYGWLAVMAATVFESESYVAGMAFALAALPFLLAVRPRPTDTTLRLVGFVLLGTVAVMICAAAKITSGFFAAIALAAMGWRMRRRAPVMAVSCAGLLLVAGFVYLKVLPRGNAGQSAVELLSSYNQYLTWQSLFSYLLPLVVLAVYLWRPRLAGAPPRWSLTLEAAPPSGLRGWWRWLSDDEPVPQFLLLSLAACLLVLVCVPMGSNIAFFSLVLFTIALALLPGALELASAIRLDMPVIRHVLGGVLMLCYLPLTIGFAFDIWVEIAGLQIEAQRVTHAPPQRLKDSIRQSLKDTHRPLSGLKALLDKTPMAKLRAALAQRDAVAVHIDSGDTGMWRWLDGKSPHWCMAPQLAVPSVTGTVELQSFAPKAVEMECSPSGANYYAPPDLNARRSVPVRDAALCRMAAPLGARDVYVLNSLTDLSRNRDIACGR